MMAWIEVADDRHRTLIWLDSIESVIERPDAPHWCHIRTRSGNTYTVNRSYEDVSAMMQEPGPVTGHTAWFTSPWHNTPMGINPEDVAYFSRRRDTTIIHFKNGSTPTEVTESVACAQSIIERARHG